MSYNVEKLTKLGALKQLAQKLSQDFASKAAVAALSEKVDNLKITGGSLDTDLRDAMYQPPTSTQYRTTGNLTAPETGSITDAALGDLLDLDELTTVDDSGVEKYEFTFNGQVIGKYTSDTQLSEILGDINANSAAGVTAEYSEVDEEFVFTAKKVGSGGKIELGEGLAEAMFGLTGYNASPNFAEAYGKAWVASSMISFKTDNGTFKVSGSGTIDQVAERLNHVLGNYYMTASYNKYTGQLEIRDNNGETVDFKVFVDDKDLGIVDLEFDESYAPSAISYTIGKDAIFTAIKVNGKHLPVTGRAVDISVPTKTSQLTNNSGFQTADEVSDAIQTAIAAASQAVFEKVDAVPDAADAQSNVLYLVMNGQTEHYDIYAKVGEEVVLLDDTTVDLSGYETSEQTNTKLDGKVDKVEGKGLSTNDFTDELKAKLENGPEVATDAEVTEMLNEVFNMPSEPPEVTEVYE